MALKQTFTLITNFNTEAAFPNCYVKVLTVEGTKNTAKTVYGIFKEKDGYLLETHAAQFEHDTNGSNMIRQAYDHLKTLPEFSGAIDC